MPAEFFPDGDQTGLQYPAGHLAWDYPLTLRNDMEIPGTHTHPVSADNPAHRTGEGRGEFLPCPGSGISACVSSTRYTLSYSIDPHTFCVSITAGRYGTGSPEEWTVSGGEFPGIPELQGKSTSPFSQSGIMVIAGLTLIGLSGLGRSRGSGTPARVYPVWNQPQTWQARSWADQPAQQGPAYQTKAA